MRQQCRFGIQQGVQRALAFDVVVGVAAVAQRPDHTALLGLHIIGARGVEHVEIPAVIDIEQHAVAGIQVIHRALLALLLGLDAGEQNGRIADHAAARLDDDFDLLAQRLTNRLDQVLGQQGEVDAGAVVLAIVSRDLVEVGRRTAVVFREPAAQVHMLQRVRQHFRHLLEIANQEVRFRLVHGDVVNLSTDMGVDADHLQGLRMLHDQRDGFGLFSAGHAELGGRGAGLPASGGAALDFRNNAQGHPRLLLQLSGHGEDARQLRQRVNVDRLDPGANHFAQFADLLGHAVEHHVRRGITGGPRLEELAAGIDLHRQATVLEHLEHRQVGAGLAGKAHPGIGMFATEVTENIQGILAQLGLRIDI